ncbi:xylulokinase [Micromonospora cremea]|uniref:xylulokinase n=1 Tax=Micromonospora cremea TaxID=709881 RepID=UPI0013564E3A|nr:FGGY family carbohydrate kinase [Micromonospora cremea]
MTVPVIVALDCSTTACKAVVFDLEGRTVCESRRYVTTTSPQPGWYEQDPHEWWEAATDALTSVVDLLLPEQQPVALGITHQRETFVCVDRNWQPIRPAILWLDNRAEDQVARLGAPDVHALTGKPPSTVPSLYKLAWLAEHEPDTIRRTHQVLDVHAYVARCLTGEAVTSWASADSTALVDLSTRTWSPYLLGLCGLTPDQVPRLAAPGDTIAGLLPDVARRTGLPPGLPVVAGAGDGQCAGIGVGALESGTAYLNLGTSFSLGAFVAGHSTYPGLRTVATAAPDASAVETLLTSGGMTMTWLRQKLLDADDPDLQAAAAQVPPGANGLLFLPYLGGRETPRHLPDVRAAFFGLGVEHGRPELLRAVIEGLAYDQRDSLNHLEQQVGADVKRITITGGLAQSTLIAQIFANVLGVPVSAAPEREGTALGAAIIAAVGGHQTPYRSVREAARTMTRTATPISPNPADVKFYEAAYHLRADVLSTFDTATAALTALRRL